MFFSVFHILFNIQGIWTLDVFCLFVSLSQANLHLRYVLGLEKCFLHSIHTLKAFLFLTFELWGVVFFDLIIKDIGDFIWSII